MGHEEWISLWPLCLWGMATLVTPYPTIFGRIPWISLLSFSDFARTTCLVLCLYACTNLGKPLPNLPITEYDGGLVGYTIELQIHSHYPKSNESWAFHCWCILSSFYSIFWDALMGNWSHYILGSLRLNFGGITKSGTKPSSIIQSSIGVHSFYCL